MKFIEQKKEEVKEIKKNFTKKVKKNRIIFSGVFL
jgi:hypothetical protein